MSSVSLGAVGKTTGPLSPCGVVAIKGQRFNATTDGTFIESEARVVVVGRQENVLVVRRFDGEHTVQPSTQDATPFQQPEGLDAEIVQPHTRLESFPSRFVFVAAGTVGALIMAISGQVPWNWDLIALPVAGLLAGSIFNYAVSAPRQLAAPFADHRLHTSVFGISMSIMMILGTVAGLGFLGGPLGASLGWFVGALGGLVILIVFSFS